MSKPKIVIEKTETPSPYKRSRQLSLRRKEFTLGELREFIAEAVQDGYGDDSHIFVLNPQSFLGDSVIQVSENR